MSNAVILGSAFSRHPPAGWRLTPTRVETSRGPHVLHRHPDGWIAFRHGVPHRWLPHQIDWRRQALALAAVGVDALLVTSSVGVLDPALPLHRPVLLTDLVWPDNRLPDGTPATLWPEPAPDHAHLVWDEGPFSSALAAQVRRLADAAGHPVGGAAVFGYHPGPRTKTSAENRLYRQAWGVGVNAMSVAPEVVLANELGIPVVGLGVGHKHSGPEAPRLDAAAVSESLASGRAALEAVAAAFLAHAEPVRFANTLYRFGS